MFNALTLCTYTHPKFKISFPWANPLRALVRRSWMFCSRSCITPKRSRTANYKRERSKSVKKTNGDFTRTVFSFCATKLSSLKGSRQNFFCSVSRNCLIFYGCFESNCWKKKIKHLDVFLFLSFSDFTKYSQFLYAHVKWTKSRKKGKR